MVLRPEHFAALRINWNDKVQSLREIAAELNVGLDSLAFVDDNPAERARVRSELPEVTVLDLPEDPMGYADTVRASPVFERLLLSTEDRERGKYYAEQRQRAELRDGAGSLEDYYYSLQQVVTVAPVQPENLARVAQLTQKTNQFNLTTRRYTEQQVEEISIRPGWDIFCVHVRDGFGDNGLVGVVITHDTDGVREIDTYLLSCRVIGRTVEKAVLAFVAEDARRRGCHELRGWFFPTKKNAPAQDFYAANGFRRFGEQGAGSEWSLDLARDVPACPRWINLVTTENAYA
jgi:FkbH-like protein